MVKSPPQDPTLDGSASAREERANVFFIRGGELAQSGELDDALVAVQSAIDLDSRNARYFNALGSILVQLNRPNEGEEALRQAQALEPLNLEITGNLALVLRHRGFHDEALATFRMVVAGSGATAKIFEQFGLELLERGRLDRAEIILEKLRKSDRNNATALIALGRIKSLYGDSGAAEKYWARLRRDDPDVSVFRAQQALAEGRIAESLQTIENALDIDPNHASAAFLWAHVRDDETPGSFTVGQVRVMITEALKNPALTNDDWLNFKYAAGKLCHNHGEHDAAFAHYHEASANVWERQPIPESFYDEQVGNVLATFDTAFFTTHRDAIDRRPQGNDRAGEGLVFVFGMPRSGTTLVEQIIARDPSVTSGGERPDVETLAQTLTGDGLSFRKGVGPLTLEQVKRLAQEHHDRVRTLSNGKKLFTDKMPINFMYLGLLRVLFPRAKFVHCMRDPMDTCLSCYFTYFVRGLIKYSYDLPMLARFYHHYRHLMERWEEAFPGYVHHVQYEQLVSDPDGTVRDLVAYCDLTWDDHFLTPKNSRGAVVTASVAQVRKPIHTGAVGRWRPYAKHLKDLSDALGCYSQDGPDLN